MTSILITLMVAFGLIILAISALSIGWLLSGKSKLTKGACGSDPNKMRSSGCGNEVKCGICEDEKDVIPKDEKLP